MAVGIRPLSWCVWSRIGLFVFSYLIVFDLHTEWSVTTLEDCFWFSCPPVYQNVYHCCSSHGRAWKSSTNSKSFCVSLLQQPWSWKSSTNSKSFCVSLLQQPWSWKSSTNSKSFWSTVKCDAGRQLTLLLFSCNWRRPTNQLSSRYSEDCRIV